MTDRPFLTRYIVGDHHTMGQSHIFARTRAQAEAIASERGLGETICSDRIPERPSVLLRRALDQHMQHNRECREQGLPPEQDAGVQAIHAIVYLIFLGLRSGVIERDEVADTLFADAGWLHEAIHMLVAPCDDERGLPVAVVFKALEQLERRVPGFLPTEDR